MVGTCTITASQPGQGSYQAANPVSISLTVVTPLTVMTRTSYSNFTAASRQTGTATITATINGGANPTGRTYIWPGGGSSNQYSMPAPAANTSIVLTVTDGASTVIDTVTVQPSPSISDDTVADAIVGKTVSLSDFAKHIGQNGNIAYFQNRLQQVTGITAMAAGNLFSLASTSQPHPLARADVLAALGTDNIATAWTNLAPYFSEDCGDWGCACDPEEDPAECELCPPDCGGIVPGPPDPLPVWP